VLNDTARLYPAKSLAAQVLGFVGDDGKGLAGVEAQYDGLLRGHSGQLLLEQDPSGRPIPQGNRSVEPAQPGTDVVLTLDEDLQYQGERALAAEVKATRAKGGSLIAMDPHTGDILALANMPTFDPNHFSRATPGQSTNRAISNVYEPGSTSKTVTAAAALEHGVVRPSTPVTVPPSLSLCPGKVVHDAEGHATETLSFGQVVAQSSNIGTIEVAQRLGRGQLVQAEQAFGYGRRTGAGLPGESAGILNPVADWHCTDWVNAIGQGVAVTVLQMTRVYATVANGGVMVEPRLLKGTIDSSGKLNPAPASARRRVISAATAKTLTTILEGVVSKGGTAPAAALADWTVAGKTGTAQKPGPDGRYMPGKFVASFIGFAPASHPAVVIAVVLDEPTAGSHFGGLVAAPVFRQVADYELHHLGIPPTVPLAQAEAAPATQPAQTNQVPP
jgi:cell division protein FtsI (penicillin-binding protein 3)